MTENNGAPGSVQRATGWLGEQHARHVVVEKAGRTVVDLPLTVFAIGAILAPHVCLLGVVIALVTRHDVRVVGPEPSAPTEAAPPPHPAPAGADVPGDETEVSQAGETWTT